MKKSALIFLVAVVLFPLISMRVSAETKPPRPEGENFREVKELRDEKREIAKENRMESKDEVKQYREEVKNEVTTYKEERKDSFDETLSPEEKKEYKKETNQGVKEIKEDGLEQIRETKKSTFEANSLVRSESKDKIKEFSAYYNSCKKTPKKEDK